MTLIHRLPLFLFSLVILGWAAAPTAAQETLPRDPAIAQKAAEEKAAAQKALERKALALLDEIIAQAQSLKLPENRIRVRAQAAEILWPRDEKRARALFMEAASDLSALIKGFDPADQYYNHGGPSPWQQTSQLRKEMIQILSQRDPKLALDFLRATRQASSPRPGQYDPETELELNLGYQIASKDPHAAFQIAETNLARGLSYQETNILTQLVNQKSEEAAILAGDILKKLRTANFLTDNQAVGVAFSLINLANQGQTNGDGEQVAPSGNKSTAIVDEASLRELMEMIISTAVKAATGSPNGADYNNVRNLLATLDGNKALIEKSTPSRTAALQQKTADLDNLLGPQEKAWRDVQTLSQQGTLDAMLEAAAKMPAEVQENAYQQAAWKAFGQGDAEQARQIITDHIADPAQRANMMANFDRQDFWRIANQGKIEEARQAMARIPSLEERVTMLTQLAANVFGRGDKKSALQLLDEARAMIGQGVENQSQLQARLQLAGGYAGLDPARSFQVLEPISEQLNKLIAAAAVLDGFEQRGGFREGEMILHGGGTIGNLTQQYAEKLAALANADFDRTTSAAESLAREDARLAVELAVVQGALHIQPAAGQQMILEGEGFSVGGFSYDGPIQGLNIMMIRFDSKRR